MKKSSSMRWMVVVAFVVIGAIGFRVASLVAEENVYIARGVLGCVVIYFILRGDYFEKGNEPVEVVFASYKSIKYFALAFAMSTVFYWGLSEILRLIFFIIRNISPIGGGGG